MSPNYDKWTSKCSSIQIVRFAVLFLWVDMNLYLYFIMGALMHWGNFPVIAKWHQHIKAQPASTYHVKTATLCDPCVWFMLCTVLWTTQTCWQWSSKFIMLWQLCTWCIFTSQDRPKEYWILKTLKYIYNVIYINLWVISTYFTYNPSQFWFSMKLWHTWVITSHWKYDV